MPEKTDAKDNKDLPAMLVDTPLFRTLTPENIAYALECSGAKTVRHEKGSRIFYETGLTDTLLVAIDGTVNLCRNSADGRRSIITVYDRCGDAIGYEMLFADDQDSGIFAQAQTDCSILMIPKDFLTHTCPRDCGFHTTMISNMMSIMAHKALSLNRRLEILMCGSLRKKIAMMLLNCSADETGEVSLNIGRQEMADFLNTARPSLSRELMKMQSDGLITTDGRRIIIRDAAGLKTILD